MHHMDDKFSLELSQEEGILLLTGARLLDKLVAGVTIHAKERDELIREIIDKLSLSVSPALASMSDELADAIVESVLGFDEVEEGDLLDDEGHEFVEASTDCSSPIFPMYAVDNTLPVLERALVSHHAVSAQVYSFARESVDKLTLNPLTIIREDGLWRMVAYCHEVDDVMVFRVDRIKELEETSQEFQAPIDFHARRQQPFASYC